MHAGEKVKTTGKSGSQDDIHCSFCRKSHREVKKLFAGPGVYICDECVELAKEVFEDRDQGHAE